MAVSFGENRTTRRKPPSYRKLLVISRIKYLINQSINQSMLSSLHKKVDFIYYGNNCHSILKKKTEKLHSEHQRLILIKFREKCDMNNKMHCKHVLLHESHTYFFYRPDVQQTKCDGTMVILIVVGYSENCLNRTLNKTEYCSN